MALKYYLGKSMMLYGAKFKLGSFLISTVGLSFISGFELNIIDIAYISEQ
jgi:hypothetical protein